MKHFFDEVADLMNSDTSRRLSRKTGIDHHRIGRMAKGMCFYMDYTILNGIARLGYRLTLTPINPKKTKQTKNR